jgi:hypothetical protein
MIFKIAEENDWELLQKFYDEVYRKGHPLQSKKFWIWQHGDPNFGSSIVAIVDNEIIGHLGTVFNGGYTWLVNLFIKKENRTPQLLVKLIEMARNIGPLAVSNSNEAALLIYRSWQWHRYYNLERYIMVHPDYKDSALDKILSPISIIENYQHPDDGNHYWEQPGLKSIKLTDGSTATIQKNAGGIRFVHIEDPRGAIAEAWEMGFKWADFLTSWSDLTCITLAKRGWLQDKDSIIPWNLNPVVPGSKCNISILSEEPLPKGYIISRTFSDHGRVGSL